MAEISILAYPPELRNQIYEMALSEETIVQPIRHHLTRIYGSKEQYLATGPLVGGLLQACRQSRAEAFGMAYRLSTLVLDMDRVSAVRYLQQMPRAARDRIQRIELRGAAHQPRSPYLQDAADDSKLFAAKDSECSLFGKYLLRNMPGLREVTFRPTSFEETEWYYSASDIADLLAGGDICTLRFVYSPPVLVLPNEQVPTKFLRVQEAFASRSQGSCKVAVQMEIETDGMQRRTTVFTLQRQAACRTSEPVAI